MTRAYQGPRSSFQCPACRGELQERRYEPIASFACDCCGGVALTIAVVRKHAPAALANAIWNAACAAPPASARRCPDCRAAMRTFAVDSGGIQLELDGCIRCHFLWFDEHELARLGVELRARPPQRLSAEPEPTRVAAPFVELTPRAFPYGPEELVCWLLTRNGPTE